MAWNEPGKSDKPDNSSSNRKPDMPPDLDEVLKNLQQKLRNLFGKKKHAFTQSTGNASPGEPSNISIKPIISFVLIIFLLVWIFSGLFIVGPAEKAAVLRFGKYVRTEDPGLHWIPPFVESRYVVNVQQVLTYPYQAEMLTQDENIVSVDLVVQYRISNLQDYLFNVTSPAESLQQATASALRQVIGQTTLDDVLTSGREKVRQDTQDVLEKTLGLYKAGLVVTDVNMQPAKPPEEVTAAFDDAVKAREDEQKFKNQAVTYANKVVPEAEGNASRIIAEANGYKQQVVLNAQAATSQFLALLPQYQAAPAVTRERMYLDALQNVFSHSSKILMDTPQSNNVMYLPLDKLMKKADAEKTVTPPMMLPSQNNVAQDDGNDTASNYPNRPSYNPSQGG